MKNIVCIRIEHANTWKPLKGLSMDIIKTVVFPLLCFSDADQELWDEDPYEYVRTKFGVVSPSLLSCCCTPPVLPPGGGGGPPPPGPPPGARAARPPPPPPPPSSPLPDLYEDFKSPVPAAMGFIQQLAAQRKKFALIPILSFCNDILLK